MSSLAVYIPASDRPSSVVVVSVTAEDRREATTVLRTRAECDAAIAQLVAARDAAFAEKMRRCVHGAPDGVCYHSACPMPHEIYNAQASQ